jgi:hypothetical protein
MDQPASQLQSPVLKIAPCKSYSAFPIRGVTVEADTDPTDQDWEELKGLSLGWQVSASAREHGGSPQEMNDSSHKQVEEREPRSLESSG